MSELTLAHDAKLVYAQPHMHLRGKDFELRLIYPTGETQTVLKAKWDFEWQMGYEFAKPIDMPKGTRMVGISHFDNSANNASIRIRPRSLLGSAELGRDEQLLHRRSSGYEDQAGDGVPAVRAEPAAAWALRADIRSQ